MISEEEESSRDEEQISCRDNKRTKARKGQTRSEATLVGFSSPGKSGSRRVQKQEQRVTMERDLEQSYSCHPHERKSTWLPLSSS